MKYKGYEIEAHEGKSGDVDMVFWSIKDPAGNKMVSDAEFANFDTVGSVIKKLKERIDKWFILPMNKKV